MVAQRVERAVVAHPLAESATARGAFRGDLLQPIERELRPSECDIGAGEIVLQAEVAWIDRDCPRRPVFGARSIAQFSEQSRPGRQPPPSPIVPVLGSPIQAATAPPP